MDDSRKPTEAHGLSASSGARPEKTVPQPPADFRPLRLVLQPGTMAVELLRNNVLVGRHSLADVRLSLPDVSRQHCRLVFADSSWHVVDLHSLNGVFVNGDRVQRETLRHGDTVRIGGFTFDVDLGPTPIIPMEVASEPKQAIRILRSITQTLPQDAPREQRRAS